jgi:hypothetical protein
MDGQRLRHARPRRRFDSLGILHHAAAAPYRRPLRGRVFSADLGFSMLTIAAGAYLCGRLLDAGIAPRTVATYTGVVMLIPAGLWALAMQKKPV